MPNVKTTKVKGGVALDITCEYCGKPISLRDPDFGMDCEDDCSKKLWEKQGSPTLDRSDVEGSLLRMLEAGIESGKREAPVTLPSFAEYADDEIDEALVDAQIQKSYAKIVKKPITKKRAR
jgi:hypothetical protein